MTSLLLPLLVVCLLCFCVLQLAAVGCCWLLFILMVPLHQY